MAGQRKERPTGLAAAPLTGRVIAQEEVRNRLAGSLRADRAAHAYLLTGTRGVGKAAVALEFAALLLCDGEGNRPCGSCPQCHAALRLQHPDLHLIVPLPPTRKAKSDEEDEMESVADRVSRLAVALARDAYTPVVVPKARTSKDEGRSRIEEHTIKISQIRSAIRAVSLKPFSARRKVFVIFHADTMNEEAQNALLKVLEEPPPDGYFLLTSENEEALRPTIRSRCQRLRLGPLPHEAIVEALVQAEIPREKAEAAAAVSDGSLVRAREFARADLPTLQEHVVDFLRQAARVDAIELTRVVGSMLNTGDLPETAPLELLALFFRDLALWAAGGGRGGQPLTFGAFQDKISAVLASYPSADFDEAAAAADQAADWLSRGYTQDYVMYDLALRLHAALGPRAGRKSQAALSHHADRH